MDRIRHDKSLLAEGGFSVTNLGNLDRIRHDQDLADGGFSVTNLGNLDRIKQDQGWLAEGGIFRHEFGKSEQDQTRSGLAG